ncbi:MAG: SusD/RagB family nutrient-binding outer membrane lipoprotein, partial [Bacteroidota bacterium]
MKKYFYIYIMSLLAILTSCQSLNEGINDNPNDITIDAIQAQSFLTGAQLGNIQVQVGHLQRISALWTRQLIGFQSSYLSLDQHNITTAESNSTWNRAYHSVLSQLRTIQEKGEGTPQLVAITEIMEAHAMGTMASLFGDIPYSEAVVAGIEAPTFDPQKAVLADLHLLLDDAIQKLENLENELVIPEDIYYLGSVEKWTQAAWTLKARYYMWDQAYLEAYLSALNGIASARNDLLFRPIDDSNTDNKNLYWQLAAGSRAGDIGNLKDDQVSYLLQIMSDTASITRTHSKTREAARLAYYIIFDSDADANQGIGAATQAMPMITFGENQLILAEAGIRTQSFDIALANLNIWRDWLNSGDAFTVIDPSLDLIYLALEEDDFEEDGVENPDGV